MDGVSVRVRCWCSSINWSASSVMVGDGPSRDVLVPRPGSLTLCTVSSPLLRIERVVPGLLGCSDLCQIGLVKISLLYRATDLPFDC